ncbi:hypothetical protein GNI_091110 [Gregarina niphandrodes]|uniref:Uncharacterized protein n=1 Tax=Gregarina niphandrodes TaxID=110365 RepID=A0A023B5E5_GRENI|nr:hypothetical protein GNI_091110 [Gregarina niphandrodes]EZG60078.1 hypothetical protein GNI_091110 [Gregarina niphandrodes]|eukprot:XP_011130862.1 hypothetical protein GNI_091110 [Gregarina niphandrodes]
MGLLGIEPVTLDAVGTAPLFTTTLRSLNYGLKKRAQQLDTEPTGKSPPVQDKLTCSIGDERTAGETEGALGSVNEARDAENKENEADKGNLNDSKDDDSKDDDNEDDDNEDACQKEKEERDKDEDEMSGKTQDVKGNDDGAVQKWARPPILVVTCVRGWQDWHKCCICHQNDPCHDGSGCQEIKLIKDPVIGAVTITGEYSIYCCTYGTLHRQEARDGSIFDVPWAAVALEYIDVIFPLSRWSILLSLLRVKCEQWYTVNVASTDTSVAAWRDIHDAASWFNGVFSADLLHVLRHVDGWLMSGGADMKGLASAVSSDAGRSRLWSMFEKSYCIMHILSGIITTKLMP